MTLDFGWAFTPEGWLALGTLTAMEIVLGIDNVIFVSLIGAKLPPARARFARAFGLGLAFLFRIASLAGLTWLIALTRPVLTLFDHEFSYRDMVLLAAGLFLIVQATLEIHGEIDDGDAEEGDELPKPRAMPLVILNIAAMDLVFSFDSILTAIGIARDLVVMVAAIMISIAIMFLAANAVAGFIRQHPTSKVLALCFLVLIGLSLVAEGTGFDVPRGYLYFAMVFSGGVEVLNIWAKRNRRRRREAAQRRGPVPGGRPAAP
ncbi:TerC family protein [Lichenibacterium dinghuense]|uniref:TerC family protein n=1 Tax=Lichenibacterium dinghuense TaxID=2895977 RepID=UPI001F1B2FDD|nr:TerC family protein [Lichenibacterium sp. 6Y81]